MGCIVAWALFLPLLILAGVVLFLFCALAEIGQLITGGAETRMTPGVARELALSMCTKFGRALPVRIGSLSSR